MKAPYVRAGVPQFKPSFIKVPARAHPLIKTLLRAMQVQEVSFTELERGTGVDRKTVSYWARNRNPNLMNIEAVLNYLGYELAAVDRTGAAPLDRGDEHIPGVAELRADVAAHRREIQRLHNAIYQRRRDAVRGGIRINPERREHCSA